MSCVSKYYVNYVQDIISGESAPTTPANTPVKCNQVSGSANIDPYHGLFTLSMRDIGRTTYIYNENVPEGFGSNSLGSHIGYFYSGTNGADANYLWAASFLITAKLP